jgi:hypothetical protein
LGFVVSNAAVKTPIGIKLLSIAFAVWPAGWLIALLYGLWSDYRRELLAGEDLNLLLIEILFCLVLIFMLSSVAIGLWKLEEGARKVALISCLVFFRNDDGRFHDVAFRGSCLLWRVNRSMVC